MITFQGRNSVIGQADRITRSVNIYPHVSESKTSAKISNELLFLDIGSPIARRLMDLQCKYACRLNSMQFSMTSGIELFRKIIQALKDKKIGNCYEHARMAEIIAKINGQKNIYPMRLFITKNSSGAEMPLEHVVSVITDREIKPGIRYKFKNNEAIIIDSWLGLSEYINKYIEKIEYDFKKMFPNMPDVDFSVKMATKDAKNIKEYKKLKQTCFKPIIRFELHYDDIVTKEQAEQLKKENPELVLNNFQNIEIEKTV